MGQRSKVARLPPAVKSWFDAALVEGNFSGYEQLEAELRARGFDIGKSSLHRYGSEFEKKLANLKLASEQAKAIVAAAPDDEGAVAEALVRMVQEHLFNLLNAGDSDKFDLPKVARAVADLGRTTISQRKWQQEVRAKASAAADATEKIVKKAGLSDAAADEIRRRILGIAT